MDRERQIRASEKLLLCQIHGVKIGGRRPRIDDFLPGKSSQNSVALECARGQVLAHQMKILHEKNSRK